MNTWTKYKRSILLGSTELRTIERERAGKFEIISLLTIYRSFLRNVAVILLNSTCKDFGGVTTREIICLQHFHNIFITNLKW